MRAGAAEIVVGCVYRQTTGTTMCILYTFRFSF